MKVVDTVKAATKIITEMLIEILTSGHHGWIVITLKHSKVESIHKIKDRDIETVKL
jgi:hypothetical protein